MDDRNYQTLSYLPLMNSDIRVFIPEGGVGDDPLHGSLKHVSLDDLSEYEALSYVWGDPKTPHLLHTPDGSRAITQSLYSSLTRLRLARGNRALWADAICINQDDNDERGRQVRLMRQIYQSSIRVLVDLGEECENSQMILGLMQMIPPADSTSQFSSQSGELPPEGDPRWKAFRTLLRRPWFRRVWVFQEFIVAVSSLFYCGGWTATWYELFGAIEKAGSAIWASFDETFEQNEATGNGLLLLWLLSELRGDYWKGEKYPLLRILTLFRWSQASRACDHFYALLGIARDGDNPALLPNYTLPIEEVILTFARYFATTENAMEVLYCAGLSVELTSSPSWIPDWTQNRAGKTDLGFKLKSDRYKAYHTTKNSTVKINLAADDRDTLFVHGGIIDSIARINQGSSINNESTSLHRLLHWLIDLECYAAVINRYPTGEDLNDVQARVLVSNIDLQGHEISPASLAEAYVAFRKRALAKAPVPFTNVASDMTPEESEELRIKARPVTDVVSAIINGRRPCLTGKGYLGHVPDATRPGDLVAIFLGGTVPFVIRPHGLDNSTFWLVGECYIHGIMKGEAFDVPGFSPFDIRLI